MKTLILLSALATVALAAPASQTLGSNQITAAQDKLLTSLKREKKSPVQTLEDISSDADSIASIPPLFRSELDSAPKTSARTLGFKKPIIVKRKHGYHQLYRDSDEEQAQADSQEKCMKEVKVKLCDATSFVKLDDKEKSSNIEDVGEQMSDNDMEQSIKMAKEAVENLQRDLQNIEHGPNAKMTQWKPSESASDAEIHQDIETARQALEHIQKNFGNLEAMNLHAATLRDAEALQDAHFKIVKPTNEEERMAQWKEALDNIQKNVEIAKNIEDSFKSSSPSSDESVSKTAKHFEQMEAVHESSTKSTDGKPGKVQDEMQASGSELKESKMEFHNNANNDKMPKSDVIPVKSDKEATLKSEELSLNVQSNAVEKKTNHEQIKQGRSSTLDLPLSTPATPMQEKLAETDKENKMKDSEKTENVFDTKMVHSTLDMKSNDEFGENIELDKHRAVKEWKKDSINKNMEHEKSAWKEPENKNMLAKSTENIAITNEKTKIDSKANMEHGKNADLDVTSLMKSVEHHDKNMEKLQTSAANMDVSKDAHLDMKSADQAVHESQQINHVLPLNPSIQMKSSEHNDEHHLSVIQNAKLHSEKIPAMREAAKFNNEFHNIQMERKTDFVEQTLPGTHDNMMAHGKSANMDNTMLSTMQMNMKDAAGKSALERNNMMQWKHDHGAARGAYGAVGPYGSGAGGLHIGGGAAGGSGAVGVFPNANVGGCAIPLLLSCSPSVVSGSLAKHHAPAYAAPGAYRDGEDFKFHNKRDILKNNKISATKVKRTPATRIIQKIPLDKNL